MNEIVAGAKTWIEFAFLIVGGLFFIASLILSIKRKKASKEGNTEFLEKTQDAFDLLNTARVYMSKVESMVGMSGEMKKDYVLTKINQVCLNLGIKFDEEKASDVIETLIQVSKEVNSREKDKISKETPSI